MSVKGPIVIVGATGLVGRHVLLALHDAGIRSEQVICVSREPGNLPEGYTIVHGDRDDSSLIRELYSRKPGTWLDLALFHPRQMDDLLTHVPTSNKPCNIVVAGTVAEYGLQSPLPPRVNEDFPGSPASRYGRDKLAAWEVAQAASHDLFWAVLPQLWGPFDRHGRDSGIVREIVANRPIVLRGNGRTLMPDGYAGTVAAALVHLAGISGSGPRRFNVAGPHPLTPYRFIEWAADAINAECHTHHVAHRHWNQLEKHCDRDLRFPFSDADLSLDLSRLASTGFVSPVSARLGVQNTALWHAKMDSPVDPSFEPLPLSALSRLSREHTT